MNNGGMDCAIYYTNHLEEEIQRISARIEENHNEIMLKIVSKSNHASNSQNMLSISNHFDTYAIDFMNEAANDDDENDNAPNEYDKFANANLQHVVMKRKRDEVLNEIKKRGIPLGMVNGKLAILLKDFKFAHMTSEALVQNWLIPQTERKIVAFKRLAPSYLSHIKGATNQRQKMATFMKVVKKFARIENCWYDDDKWDYQKVSIYGVRLHTRTYLENMPIRWKGVELTIYHGQLF